MVGRTGAIPRPCSLTENASRVFLAQFVGDASAGQPHELGERCVRLTARRVLSDPGLFRGVWVQDWVQAFGPAAQPHIHDTVPGEKPLVTM